MGHPARMNLKATSERAETQAEGELWIYRHLVHYLLERVIAELIGHLKLTVVGVELWLSVNLHTKLGIESEEFTGNRAAETDTKVGTERFDTYSTVDIAVCVNRNLIIADHHAAVCHISHEIVAVSLDLDQIPAAEVCSRSHEKATLGYGIYIKYHLPVHVPGRL